MLQIWFLIVEQSILPLPTDTAPAHPFRRGPQYFPDFFFFFFLLLLAFSFPSCQQCCFHQPIRKWILMRSRIEFLRWSLFFFRSTLLTLEEIRFELRSHVSAAFLVDFFFRQIKNYGLNVKIQTFNRNMPYGIAFLWIDNVKVSYVYIVILEVCFVCQGGLFVWKSQWASWEKLFTVHQNIPTSSTCFR